MKVLQAISMLKKTGLTSAVVLRPRKDGSYLADRVELRVGSHTGDKVGFNHLIGMYNAWGGDGDKSWEREIIFTPEINGDIKLDVSEHLIIEGCGPSLVTAPQTSVADKAGMAVKIRGNSLSHLSIVAVEMVSENLETGYLDSINPPDIDRKEVNIALKMLEDSLAGI